MPTAIEKRLNAIERMLKEISGRIEQRPVVQTVPRVQYLKVLVDRGNTLESGDLGIKYSSSIISSFPSSYDPDATSTFIDGVGRGTLYVNNIAIPGYVLILNDSRSSIFSAVIQSDTCWSTGPLFISSGGGTFTQAYLIG